MGQLSWAFIPPRTTRTTHLGHTVNVSFPSAGWIPFMALLEESNTAPHQRVCLQVISSSDIPCTYSLLFLCLCHLCWARRDPVPSTSPLIPPRFSELLVRRWCLPRSG